jgi:hypothetical protein
MSVNTSRYVTFRIHKERLIHYATVLSVMLVVLAVATIAIDNIINPPNVGVSDEPESVVIVDHPQSSYPVSGGEIDLNLLSLQIPPPSQDALPYDVRDPLFNGASVPVKKRWLWVPPDQQIRVTQRPDGDYSVDVPVGTLFWKEFYIETDRGSGLIERRLLVRMETSSRYPQGWAFYTSHHRPETFDSETAVIVDSASDEASQYIFQSSEWLPTQTIEEHFEVRFRDIRQVDYAFIFPGQIQCIACHGGAAGSYPNLDETPIFAFALHPNNLTPESYQKITERGWLVDGHQILSAENQEQMPILSPELSFEITTRQLVGFMRNNCASCHNDSIYAAGSMTSFILDPNYDYTPNELIDLFSINGVMVSNAKPLVTVGDIENSEIWLRLHGQDGRRRMPPAEGGLPDVDPSMLQTFEEWIILAQTYGKQ